LCRGCFSTNDGDLAYLLSHPRYSVPRIYLAKVSGVPEERDLNRLKRGVSLEDGKARAASVSILRLSEKNSWVRIVVTEGRNHLVKRMLFAIGHSVLKLKRIEFGPLRLGTLSPGQFRYLTPEELNRLKKYVDELGRRSGHRGEPFDSPA
jgi:pseudouridine synthase